MRLPKPWFRKRDGWWYVQVRRGRKRDQVKLAYGAENEVQAQQVYHQIMADEIAAKQQEKARPPRRAFGVRQTAYNVINLFLADLEKTAESDATYAWYHKYCSDFAKSIRRDLPAEPKVPPVQGDVHLKPFHVNDWIKSKEGWGSSASKNGAARAVKRAFAWAKMEGHIATNPIADMKAAPKVRREKIVDQELYQKVLENTKDRQFKDVLGMVWNSGCRPQEVTRGNVENFDEEFRRLVFQVTDSKGKKSMRVIYLNDEAFEIVKRNCYINGKKRGKKEPIFRNTRGKRWASEAIGCRFQKLKPKIGELLCLYNFRHTFADDAIKKGVDVATVAGLMGHSSPNTLLAIYQHVVKDAGHMAEGAKRVR